MTQNIKNAQMSPVATSKSWSGLHTDDDIQAAVSTFLEEESHSLNGKTLHESIVEVSRWLGSQIQQEREGWAYKVKVAMQEIETNRRETLKVQGVVQECTDQLRMITEACNVDDEILDKIGKEDSKKALPMYIECLADLINSLVEDRLRCLQLLNMKENDGRSVSTVLKQYLHKINNNTDQSKLQEKEWNQMEKDNTALMSEVTRLKKQLSKSNEDHEKLRMILQVMHSEAKQQKEMAMVRQEVMDRSSPSSLVSSLLPNHHKNDSNNIQIPEEKLIKLRTSARKLESSLQDALNQIDSFRKNAKSTMKYSHPSGFSSNIKLKPLLTVVSPDSGEMRREYKRVPGIKGPRSIDSNPVFEIAGEAKPMNSDLSDVPRRSRHRKVNTPTSPISSPGPGRTPRRPEKVSRSSRSNPPTFRSLVRSIDEMRIKQSMRVKGGKKVSKCLRCQKLFTLNDNHKKSCCYHPRSKERVEEYTNKGRLTRVTYLWQCCQQGVESQGCCYGQHI